MTMIEYLKYDPEERMNMLTHLLGCILAMIGGILLLYLAPFSGSSANFLAIAIYSLASVMVFGSSALYHAVAPGKLKRSLQKLDHISIFFMIAGTHTPIVIFFFDDTFADYYLVFLWSLVALGIIYKLFWMDRYEKLGLLLYIIMGWLAVLILPELIELMSILQIFLIVSGGLAYTAGIIFYRWHSLRYHHAIWHLFVLLGGILHYAAIFLMISS